MRKKLNDLRRVMLIALAIQAILLAIAYFGFQLNVIPGLVILVIEAVMFLYAYDRYVSIVQDHSSSVEDILGSSADRGFLYGEVGMVFYDDEYMITWMSDLFKERSINQIGSKVLAWIPEANDLLSGSTDSCEVRLDDHLYKVCRKSDEQVLFFRDITELDDYRTRYSENMPVIGMASLDNYEESTQYEDEAVVSAINVAVRSPLTEYCKDHGILVRRVNNYRYLLILNEKIFSDLSADHFSILGKVRRAAQKQDVSITLSMAFARGTENFIELDDMVSNLLDLAQSRGGDQVAVQVAGEEVKYFGGSSEATEKRSRVRVRVMAHSLRELISRSTNVIILGHKEADFDCIGSAIGMARIVQALNKQVVILAKTGGIEEKLYRVMSENEEQLKSEVRFVTENEALNQLQYGSLVLVMDHHNVKQSNGAKVLEQATRIAVIDHHRRSTEMGFKPTMVYLEAGASSTSELITELMPYMSNRTELSELDATMMLTGMIVDTQRFRVRTGFRTYEAAASLRRMGADPLKADAYLKDTMDEFEQKTSIFSAAENYSNGIVIVPVKNEVLTRSKMSQVADHMLSVRGVEAAFVISDTIEGNTAISARSNGTINVQIIMEKMNGGGHLSAAATQRPKTDIDKLKEELIEDLNQYFMEVQQDESHSEN